jgi:hypothetical protein
MHSALRRTASGIMRTLSLLTPNLIGLGGAVGFLCGWGPVAPASGSGWIGLVGVWMIVTFLLDTSLRRRAGRWLRPRSRFLWTGVVGGLLIAAIAGFVSASLRGPLATVMAGAAAGAGLRQLFVRSLQVSRSLPGEAIRWACVFGAIAFVIHPYATRGLLGGGDAQHYVQQLADVIVQADSERFPFFVGRSAYAYNGDIHPLRTAPYFQYVGTAANLLTGRTLGTAGVQNLLIVVSLFAAGVLVYILGLRVGGRSLAWPAALLTVACVSSQGVLALVYSGDMIASWMTLPYLPGVIYGLLRVREAENPTGALLLVVICLAATWLAHAPIAFWVSILTIFSLGEFALRRGKRGQRFWLLAGGGTIGLILAGYVFVSVATLEMPDDPNLLRHMRNGGMIHTLRVGWAGLFSPVDAGATNLLANLQLSPALWLALVAGVIGACAQRRVNFPFLVYSVGLLLLLTPLDLTAQVWGRMPAAVLGATDKWPMQRFYPILSFLVPFVALLGLSARLFIAPRARWILNGLLAIGCVYSLTESQKFIRRGKSITNTVAFTEQRLREENSMLSRYTYEYFGQLPSYFRHGPMSPLFQNRLLSLDTLHISSSNLRAVMEEAPGVIKGISLHHLEKTDYGCRFIPKLRLDPGQVYVVNFDFGPRVPEGVLELTSPIIYRQYSVSPTMEPLAYRDGIGEQRGFALWTTNHQPDEVELRYYLTPGKRLPNTASFKVRLIHIDPRNLPIRLERLIPYTLSLTATGPGWLGTPKIFVPGYVAFVDGKETPVARSPEGLVMVPVEQGSREVILRYRGPWILRVAFWVTATGWLVVLIFLVLPKRWKLRVQERQAAWLIRLGKTGAVATIAVSLTAGITLAFNRPPPLEKLSPRERISLSLTLPVGRENATETIASRRIDNREIALFARYVSGKEVVFGFLRDGQPWLTSAPTPVNYILPYDLDFVWSQSDPAHPDRKRFRVVVGHRVLIDRFVSIDAPPDPRSDGHAKTSPFSGEVHAAETVHAALPPQPSQEFPSVAAPR